MSSYLIITENIHREKWRSGLCRAKTACFMNFTTPHDWTVGDTVALQVNRPPYPMAFDSESRVLFSLPKEPPAGWGKGFYRLRNERTSETFALDFDGIRGWESFAREAKRQTVANAIGGKNRKVMRGSREL